MILRGYNYSLKKKQFVSPQIHIEKDFSIFYGKDMETGSFWVSFFIAFLS